MGSLGTTDGICVRPVTDGNSGGVQSAQARRWALRQLSGDLLPGWRVGRCGQRAIKGRSVAITRNAEGRHGCSNVRVCGSVWVCPVCAAKIASRRAVEIQAAVEAHHRAGGDVLMVALTVRHRVGDGLDGLVRGLAAAQRRLWAGRIGQRMRVQYGVLGLVRNQEVTWGLGTGWHPHAHVLLFTRSLSYAEVDELLAFLAARWTVVVGLSGLYASLEHGLVGERVETMAERVLRITGDLELGVHDAEVRADAEAVAFYNQKFANLPELVRNEWGPAQELTWAHIKQSKGKRWTAWALLAAAGEDNGESRAPALWQEFALAFRGRAQLYWSRGLREALELAAAETDEEAAAAEDVEAVEVARVTIYHWSYLVRSGAAVKLFEFLDLQQPEPETYQRVVDDFVLRSCSGRAPRPLEA